MSGVPENGPMNPPLICEMCNYIQFSSYSEFNQHHLSHVRQPRVSLTRLSNSCVEKIKRDSYRVNSGVARRSKKQNPPVSLSVVNQNGNDQFLVVKKQSLPSSSNREESPEFGCLTVAPEMEKEDEMLKRLGSRVSVTRRRRTSTRTLNRSNTTNTAESTSTNSTPLPKILIRVPYVKLERIDPVEIESHTSGNTPTKRTKIDVSQDNSSHSNNSNTPVSHAVAEPTKARISNKNDPPVKESRRYSLTKHSNCGKKQQQSPHETNENDSVAPLRERADTPRRAPERRSSAECKMPDQIANSEDTNMNTTEPPPMPSTSSGFPMNMDLSACIQTSQAISNTANSELESACSTLINSNLKDQQINTENFNTPSLTSESFVEATNFVAEAEEVHESLCESLTSDCQDSGRGPQQPGEQAAFWSNLQRAVTINPNSSQDLLLGHPIPNNDTITANFLHSILSGQVQYGITTENAEFVSLERLASQQQQQTNIGEITPMEQLTQQVHQLPNTPPQFNVSHHIQAPPPLHAAGVPLSQQPTYERVGHVQPTMGPPPLFQGFTIYPNQTFQQQGSSQQVLPRPPALQQCPQLQAGAYQNMAQPQPNLTRQKVRPSVKRNMPGPPPPSELVAPKQDRPERAVKGKSQLSKGKGKGKAPVKPSSSGTRAPAKRTMDPQMVASILAARGITVTPSTSRPGSVVQRPRQKSTPSSPALKITSAISITPSSQNMSKTGKPEKKPGNAAAPAQRRNSAPIINNDIERPERCRTVDLTDDKEPQEDLNAPGPSVNRFLCNECGQKFPTAASLELHRASHRSAETPTFRCEPCNIEFSVAEDLERHRSDNHKYRRNGPNWVIPVIDLDFPGAEERLLEYGITNFIPLSFDEDGGNLSIPIVRQDTPRQHRQFIGMSNAIVLGQIRSLLGPRHY